MELFYILKYKILILKHRLEKFSVISKLIMLFFILALIFGIFMVNIAFLSLLQLDYETYISVYTGVNILIIVFMLSFLIKKSYSNSFNVENDYILHTAPISLTTIFFYKAINVISKFLIPFLIITVPDFVAYGIVNNFNCNYYVFGIISLFLALIIASSIIGLLTIIVAKSVKETYRKTFIDIIGTCITIGIIVFFISYGEISDISKLMRFFQNNVVIQNIFFAFKWFNLILIDFNNTSLIIVPLLKLCLCTLLIMLGYFLIYRNMYLKGCFIESGINTEMQFTQNNNIFYIGLKKVFKTNYMLIYKDFLIFIRSMEKWGLVATPIVLSVLPFLTSEDIFSYTTITQIIVILFLWMTVNLSFDSIKSEGSMLKHLKNSSFNIKNIIYSKVSFASIISVFIYIIIAVLLAIILKFNLYEMFILSIRTVGMIIITSVICVSIGLALSKEDENEKITIKFLGEILSYFFMIIFDGIAFIATGAMLSSNIIMDSKISILVMILVGVLFGVIIALFVKFFIKEVGKKIIF